MPRITVGLVVAAMVLLASAIIGETIHAVVQGRDQILQLQQARAPLPR